MINGNRRFAGEPNSSFLWNGATHSSFFENIDYTPSNMMNNTIAKRSVSTTKTALYDLGGLTFEYSCENATLKHSRQTNYVKLVYLTANKFKQLLSVCKVSNTDKNNNALRV